MPLDDTIAAIATPPGVGGIGIIRVSGPKAEAIARLIYQSPRGDIPLESHRLYHGRIVSPETGGVLDEVLVTLMRKPRSYTGEDLLEIQGHGSPLILETILTEVIRAGARPAAAGEFTRRAFLNGRMDLAQAEALMNLLTAGTRRGLDIAHAQLQGALSRRMEAFRRTLADVLAALEADIDFAEDDGTHARPAALAAGIQEVVDGIRGLLATCAEGIMIRKGVSAVIVGRANVGKSSLLNRLLGENRAIVTAIPGTTRDFIEESIDLRGVAVRLTDTAGLRNPDNPIEQEGIERVWERLSMADLVIPLFDGSEALTGEDREIVEKTRSLGIVPVINKTDLPPLLDDGELRAWLAGPEPLRISAKTGFGIPALRDALYRRLAVEPAETAAEIVITNIRHKTVLEKTLGHLQQAQASLADALSPELIAFDLREALDSIGEIAGFTTPDEVLDRIFSNFCIGK